MVFIDTSLRDDTGTEGIQRRMTESGSEAIGIVDVDKLLDVIRYSSGREPRKSAEELQ